MSNEIPVLKEESQTPIPTLWRKTFAEIVEAFVEGDFILQRGVIGVKPVKQEDGQRIANNINEYGCRLVNLPDKSWQTSVCQWMDGYWDVLIDLFTVEEGASDLALSVRVYEKGASYSFEVQLVYVP